MLLDIRNLTTVTTGRPNVAVRPITSASTGVLIVVSCIIQSHLNEFH